MATVVIVNGEITFTLSDYVATHDDITGTAKVEAHFDQAQITPGKANHFDFQSGGAHWRSTVDIDAPISAGHAKSYKIGFWTDPRTQGSVDPAGAISWRIYSQAGPWNSLVFTDILGPGQSNDCASILVVSSTRYHADGSLVNPQPLGDRATLDYCRAGTFRITIGAVNPAEVVRVTYTSTVTDQTATTFTNEDDVTSNGPTLPRRWSVSHYGAYGQAVGVTAPPTAPTTSKAPPTTTAPTTSKLPPTTAARTTTPSRTSVTPQLPNTGTPTGPLGVLAALLLLGGATLLMLGRRRGTHEG